MSGTNEYPCHGFNSDLPKGKASGKLLLTESTFDFQIASKHIRVPLDGCNMNLGGASDRLVFIAHPNVPEWKFYTADRSILKNPHITDHPELSQSARKARSKRLGAWSVLAAIALLILAIPVILLLRMDLFTGAIAKQVPISWEQQLGESALAQYRLGLTVMEEEAASALLKPLTTPLLEAVPTVGDYRPYEFQFYISQDSTPNAFALPGGTIVIHSGLILQADSPEELLGVLGHEISHVTLQHGLRNVIGTAGLYLVVSALLGDASGLMATLAGSAPFLLNQSYSRKFETQSDQAGHELLVAANINPSGLASFFEKLMLEEQRRLKEIENDKTRDLVEGALGFLSTHPTSEKRIAHFKSLPNPVEDPLDLNDAFLHLQSMVRQFTENSSEQSKATEAPNTLHDNHSPLEE